MIDAVNHCGGRSGNSWLTSRSHLATKLRSDLQKTQQDLLVANKELETQMRKSSQLAVANQKLEAALAEVKQTASSSDDTEGLRERITGEYSVQVCQDVGLTFRIGDYAHSAGTRARRG